MFSTTRIEREAKTLRAMFTIYCRGQHAGHGDLCAECLELQEYSLARLERCPFQQGKTTCAKCPVHCYKADMRTRIRQMMRYAGPRMLFKHPLLTLFHYLDGRREEPIRAERSPG